MTKAPEELRARAEAWMAADPDPSTREELRAILAASRWDDLADRLEGRLEFGTAGMRGVLGAGSNRMNRAVVREATAGLCAALVDRVEGARERGLVIGYDGRRMSRELAVEAAEIALGHGFRVKLFGRDVPTPLVSYACVETGAAGGAMVTASHNPPEYNGFKVYWSNGAQIIPPEDTLIADAIARCGPANVLPTQSLAEGRASGMLEDLGEAIEDRYHAALQDLLVAPEVPRNVRIAYTALHGVGERHVRRALATAGFAEVASVAEQAEPNGDFPTVRFPNPEEEGAMDAVLALARDVDAELVLANDPDADRLAVAVRSEPGVYVRLTGNEVGCLLAHYLLEHGDKNAPRLVISSLVSTPMIGDIARAQFARWEKTLTGFKWIANRAIELEAEGLEFVLGFEEALGYTIGSLVRDKDGIGAALVAAEMAAWCKAHDRTLAGELDLCAHIYGLYVSRQISLTMKGADGAARIRRIMSSLRERMPASLGGYAVLAVQDYLAGTRKVRTGSYVPLALPRSDMLVLELEDDHRVTLRPSGTEPKIKLYVDHRVEVGEKESIDDARARGERAAEALAEQIAGQLESAPEAGTDARL